MKKRYKFFGLSFYLEKTPEQKTLSFKKLKIFTRQVLDDNTQANALVSNKIWDGIRIAVQLRGGIGDQLIGCNYVKALKDKLNDANIKIDVYCRSVVNELFLSGTAFINSVSPESDFNPSDGMYDLYIRLDRFPVILECDEEKIQHHQTLYKYVSLVQNFKKLHQNVFFTGRSEFDSICNIYTLIKGQKRFNQMDIDGFLGIGEKFQYAPKIQQTDVFQKFKIPKKFITIHRGVDTNRTCNSNKLWPMESYNQLIKMIKSEFPEYTIVQLGVNKERCPDMENVDINLVGKTSMTDMVYILKKSLLHIDGEGGQVHIRHAINGGKSVVFFGPTSVDFYGYSENINLYSNVCPHWCEHIKERWDEGCLKTGGIPLCMVKISPEMAFAKIKAYLNKKA